MATVSIECRAVDSVLDLLHEDAGGPRRQGLLVGDMDRGGGAINRWDLGPCWISGAEAPGAGQKGNMALSKGVGKSRAFRKKRVFGG
jgi:hypothetical protein